MYFLDSFGVSSFRFRYCRAAVVLESNHVRDAGAEPWITAGGPAARKLPRRRQGENPHAGQPVALARAQGGQTAAGAQGLADGAGSVRGV